MLTQFGCVGSYETIRDLVDTIERNGYGKVFREARKKTYEYFNGPANIC